MGEQRKPVAVVLLKKPGKTTQKIEVFDAALWGEAGWRLRRNGRWLGPERAHCQDLAVIGQRVTDALAELLEQAVPEPEEAPQLPKGSRVAVRNGTVCPLRGELKDCTWTRTEPIRGYDGRWYVSVTLWGQGAVWVPVDAVELR